MTCCNGRAVLQSGSDKFWKASPEGSVKEITKVRPEHYCHHHQCNAPTATNNTTAYRHHHQCDAFTASAANGGNAQWKRDVIAAHATKGRKAEREKSWVKKTNKRKITKKERKNGMKEWKWEWIQTPISDIRIPNTNGTVNLCYLCTSLVCINAIILSVCSRNEFEKCPSAT